MIEYTVGVFLNKDLTKVVMILKNRPENQKGLYNFPGGKIESDEDCFCSIAREFEEECGIKTNFQEWYNIGVLSDNLSYTVEILTYLDTKNSTPVMMEDQPVTWINIDSLPENKMYHVSEIINDALHFWRQENDRN